MTEPRFLLDANILVYLVENLSEPLLQRVGQCAKGELVTSAFAYAEFARGIDWSQAEAEDTVKRLFAAIEVLAFDVEAAGVYARRPFRRASFDLLIAAHALAADLTLVTANIKDFGNISELRVEDWTR